MRAALLVLLLAGCSLLTPAKHDVIETTSYIEVWQWAARYGENCGDRRQEGVALGGIAITMERLSLLVAYGPDEDSRAIYRQVLAVVGETRSGASASFCEESSRNMKTAVERALKAVGRRPR